MRITVYIRVAKGEGRTKISATTKPNYKPLTTGSGWREKPMPTAAFAIALDVPDVMFKRAEQVLAELEVAEHDIRIAAEVEP